MSKVQTQEIAKNIEAEVSIHCTACNKVYKLQECLKEEAMPYPNHTVTEGYLICPICGDRKHCYYMSEQLRFKQTQMTKALKKYHNTQSRADWRVYKTLHDSFQTLFDTTQKHYKDLFGKEEVSESRGN